DPNGNVGIGTASPLARLHTVGRTASAATDFIGLFSETGVTPEATAGLTTALAQKAAVVQGNGGAYFVGRDVTNDIEFIFGTSIAGSAFAGATTNHDFQLRTNNVDRITIKNTTGNVGIGTSNPTYKLQVSSSSTAITPVSLANSVLRLSNSDTTNGNYASIEFGSNDTSGTIRSGAAISGIFTNHDVSMVQSELGFYTRNISGTVNEAMRIDENGNVGIGDTNPAALFTVGNGSLFQVSSTGAVTTTGGIVSLNTNSNFAVNVATGTSTGAVTIGGNANTVTIDSSDWNITAAGAMTGISGITNNAAITSVGGQVNLNVSSNYVINLATGTSTGTITLGGTGTQTISVGNGAGIKTVNLGSATTTSTTTLLSGSGGLNLNVNNSQPTNIATGTSAGAISIGGGSNTVAIDSTSWDISTAGVLSGATGITSSGTINFSGLTASSLVFTDASDNLVSSAASAAVASSITDETGTGLLVFNDSPSLTTPTASSITVTALNVNGTVYSNAGVLTNTNPSDIRLKENVQPLENVLDKIALLKPVTFDWISNGEASRGFIAQEVEKVFPELVGNNGEYKGLYTTDFIPYLVKGIQEQQTQIAESTDQLGDLNLKTNQNITTLEELQSSIDAQLGAVSKNINTINAALATGQASLDDYG
ncbi:MAG: tail fiber domain-containing protein, partial [bacterium]|nr:tail fiber domain-containing protein [bacterium]